MPLPNFVSGEVLSAMRLNALVDIANKASLAVDSISMPFEQVELNADIGATMEWLWMFRYIPNNRYWRLRYLWQARSAGASIVGTVSGATVFTDASGGPNGQTDRTIDLQPLGLLAGQVYTFNLVCTRASSDFCRIIWLFNTNNPSYAPTII